MYPPDRPVFFAIVTLRFYILRQAGRLDIAIRQIRLCEISRTTIVALQHRGLRSQAMILVRQISDEPIGSQSYRSTNDVIALRRSQAQSTVKSLSARDILSARSIGRRDYEHIRRIKGMQVTHTIWLRRIKDSPLPRRFKCLYNILSIASLVKYLPSVRPIVSCIRYEDRLRFRTTICR